jgi:GNAT superfamily N-acetyltransferase
VTAVDLDEVAAALEADRVWCAYALADLDPPYAEHASWLLQDGAVVLRYVGFDPPILFAHGDPATVSRLFSDVAAGDYQFGLLGSHRAAIRDRLKPTVEAHMWRMVLRPEAFHPPPAGSVERLTRNDLPRLEALFAGAPSVPDAFHPSQLDSGCFFGISEGRDLVSVAGTHVYSIRRSVGAVGNVFTRADRRGRGLATRSTGAVTAELLGRGMKTIVLNVAMDNEPAVRAYRTLGFMPFCGYYEGVGRLLPAAVEGNEDVRPV